MNRLTAFTTATLMLVAACGGAETGEQTESAGETGAATGAAQPGAAETGAAGALSMPDWYQIDNDARTVTLDISAGATPANNNWNFNGFHGGEGEIVVPEGYQVTINFTNDDPNIAHSIGVDSRTRNFPGSFSNPQPVFEGGMSSNPTSMTEGTMPGQSETITFTASEAGEYTLVCYIPGHASIGMWMPFTVSSGDEAGVRGDSGM